MASSFPSAVCDLTQSLTGKKPSKDKLGGLIFSQKWNDGRAILPSLWGNKPAGANQFRNLQEPLTQRGDSIFESNFRRLVLLQTRIAYNSTSQARGVLWLCNL